MEKMKNNIKGITLVALVITIIILLILATISIQSLTNTGIFKRAQEAKNAMENAEAEQALILNEYENELNSYYTPESKPQIKLSDAVKVGNYVEYKPDNVSNTDTKYTTLISNLGTYSGSTENTTSTLTQENLNWRVLDIQNGQVRLISEVPTTSKIYLKGYNGYNNSVKLLDDTCTTLYSNSNLSIKVQNLKIEDITKYMNTQPTEDTTTYSPSNKLYANMLLKEKGQTVNGTQGTELDISEQTEFINQTTKTEVNSWQLKNNFWYQTINIDYFINSIYYKLFLNNGSDYPQYWISSRCILADSENASFIVRRVNDGGIYGHAAFSSNNFENPYECAFRPVITLNSNVQMDTENSGDGSTAEQAYKIK